MKTALRYFMVVTLVLSIIVCNVCAYADSSTYFIAGDYVRVRSTPENTPDNIIGKLPYGTKVEVLGKSGFWVEIRVNGQTGYVASSFISKTSDKASDSSSESKSGSNAYSNSFGLTKKTTSLKSKPSSSASSICSIPYYTVVKVKATKDNWAQIHYAGHTGYVRKNDLKIKSAGNMSFLASYTMTYSCSDKARSKNISKAVSAISGRTIKSGQSFSFLKTVGTNYSTATEFGTYSCNGGGLTHVASCLYQAVHVAQKNGCNISVKTKHRYSEKTPYCSTGEEAFISIDDGYDFTFKNNSGSSIKIYALTDGSRVLFMIFQP